MARTDAPKSLYGKTLRWTFKDAPGKNTTYEHTFNKDGSVDFSDVQGKTVGAPTHAKNANAVKIADGIFAVSYLGDSGYTLTVVLDFETMKMVGFASNNQEWSQHKGTFKVIEK